MENAVVLLIAVALLIGSFPREATADEIRWPSERFPTLQSAVDALADGGTLLIGPGEFRIDQPVRVVGKRIVVQGAGSGLLIGPGESRIDQPVRVLGKSIIVEGAGAGRKRLRRVTHLIGPPPRPVVDKRGTLVLRAEAVEGLFNFLGAGAFVTNLRMSGFDAGIVARPDREGRLERGPRVPGAPRPVLDPTIVDDVVISRTGRGILALSTRPLIVTNSLIEGSVWNGISVASQLGPEFLASFHSDGLVINDPTGVGIYLSHTKGLPRNLWVNLVVYGFESCGRRWHRLCRKPRLARPNSDRARRSQGSRGG